MIKNILNGSGEIIGELEVSDDTPDSQVAEMLALYSFVDNPTSIDIVTDRVKKAVDFGNKLILEFAIENVASGITQAGLTKSVSDYCSSLQSYLVTGSLYAAMTEIDSLIAATPPENLAPYVTIDRLNSYKAKIQAYLA